MPFLLIEHPDPPGFDHHTLIPPACSTVHRTPPWRWLTHVNAHLVNTHLGVQAPAHLTILDTSDGPLWLVLDGFVATGEREYSTEYLAARYRREGFAALSDLPGNYALAVILPQQRTWHACRDRLGGRTLYWRDTGRMRALASHSSLLARLSPTPPQEDPRFMAALFALRGAPTLGLSAFREIRELRPGERLHADAATLDSQRPSIEFAADRADADNITPDTAVARFTTRFEQAVAATLGADGPVAVMLSGGLDSGPVAVVAAERLRARGRRLQAVSWTLPAYPSADERRWIEASAAAAKLPLTLFDGSDCLPFSDLEQAPASPDLPMYNAFRRLIDRCYREAASAGCAVILNGNAGDELYPALQWLLLDRWRRREWGQIARLIGRTLRGGGPASLWRHPAIRHALSQWWPARHWQQPPPDWLTPRAAALLDGSARWPPEAAQHPFPDYAAQLLGARMAFGRAHENLTANRHGVDRRDPFHNEALVRFMLNAPFSLSYRDGYDKWLMRRAMRGRLPDEVRLKPRTGLLNSFFDAGFKAQGPALQALLFEQDRAWADYVREQTVRRALQDAEAPAKHRVLVGQCVGYVLWRRYWAEVARRK